MMTSIVKVTHAAIAEGKDPQTEMTKFLLNYRNTTHNSTGKKPSKLMMNRDVKTGVPMFIRPATGETHRAAKSKNEEVRRKYKQYGDKRRRARH